MICIRLITYLLEDLSRKLSTWLKLSPAFNHHQRGDRFLSVFFTKNLYFPQSFSTLFPRSLISHLVVPWMLLIWVTAPSLPVGAQHCFTGRSYCFATLDTLFSSAPCLILIQITKAIQVKMNKQIAVSICWNYLYLLCVLCINGTVEMHPECSVVNKFFNDQRDLNTLER